MKKNRRVAVVTFSLILLSSGVSTFAAMVDSWHWRNPTPFSDTMRNVCFGAGEFVAVGSGGLIHTSHDGQLWDDGQRPVSSTLNRVIYVNGQFVAVGNNGTILTSTNGIYWTPQVSGTTNNLFAVSFGNGFYVACGAAGRLVISTNGSSWNVSSVETTDLNWITFGNGVFLLPTPNLATAVQLSTNALNWTQYPIPAPINNHYTHHLFQTEFGNGVFVATVEDEVYYSGNYYPVGHLYQSSDGMNWMQGAEGGPLPFIDLSSSYYNHLFLAFVNGSFFEFSDQMYYSSVENVYNVIAANASGYVLSLAPSDAPDAKYIAYGNGRYVLIEDNGKCWTSTTATNWTTTYGGMRSKIYQILGGASNLVVLASGQPILVSPDGINFTAANNSPTGTLDAVAFDGTNYVAVGGSSSGTLPPVTTGLVCTSTNSTDWVSRTSNVNQPLTAICRGPARWVAVGGGGAVISSPNTLAWTLRSSGTALNLSGVAYGNGNYVAVGNGGSIISSPDGATWDVQYSGTTSNLNCVCYIANEFLAVGDGGLILTSPDGATWSGVPSGTTATLNSIAYGGGYDVICGAGIVLASTNGTVWQDISSKVPVVPNASSVAFINQSFWIAGGNGSILQSDSSDGIPHLIGYPLSSGNGGFRVKIALNIPPRYRIQGSTNFVVWQDLVSITNGTTAVWDDTNGLKFPDGFYRIAAP